MKRAGSRKGFAAGLVCGTSFELMASSHRRITAEIHRVQDIGSPIVENGKPFEKLFLVSSWAWKKNRAPNHGTSSDCVAKTAHQELFSVIPSYKFNENDRSGMNKVTKRGRHK